MTEKNDIENDVDVFLNDTRAGDSPQNGLPPALCMSVKLLNGHDPSFHDL